MEDLSNADRPKTSSSIGQEASTESERQFRTHSPEQERQPLSEQDLLERIKHLESEFEIFKKLLQHEKEGNLEKNQKIEDLQEKLLTSEKKVLELEKTLDAQKNLYKSSTSKAQKAIHFWTEEYAHLKESFDVLNGQYKQQQVEDEMKKMAVGEDKIDGSGVVEEKTTLTISDDASTNIMILPSVQKELKPRPYWSNPFKCQAGCVISATHYVLSENWKDRLCEIKFPREVQRQIDEMNRDLQEANGIPTENEKIECSLSLNDFLDIGLLKLVLLPSGDIRSDQLCQAIERLEIKEKALIVISRDDGLDHCMVIYRYSDQSKPNAEIFDVQSGKMWPRSAEDVSKVEKFQIFRIEESKKKEFREKCSIRLCKNERKCACRVNYQRPRHQCNPDL